MKNGIFEGSIATILALGILPPIAAFSGLHSANWATSFLVPAVPLLIYFGWRHRHGFTTNQRVGIIGFLGLGTASTIIAGAPCNYPVSLLSEWFTLCLGALAAFCFSQLKRPYQATVLTAWGLIVMGSAFLDRLFPQIVEWLKAFFLDPNPITNDWEINGRRVLSGIYGRQTLSKLLCWFPWLLLTFVNQSTKKLSSPASLAIMAIGILSAAATLATNQRGPFLASMVGWIAFAAHQHFKCKNPMAAAAGGTALILLALSTFTILPADLLQARLRSLIGITRPSGDPRIDTLQTQSRENEKMRIRMTIFSFKIIGAHPFGHACIPWYEFPESGLTQMGHAHNMFLQQFRERGWLFGCLHLGLWIFAFVLAWRLTTNASSALVAGTASIWVSGMLDHPWPTLSLSVVLWVFIFSIFRAGTIKKPTLTK